MPLPFIIIFCTTNVRRLSGAPMANALSLSLQSPPPPPPPPAPVPPAHRSTISPFYYSLLGIASIAVILIAYNIVVVGWCWQHHRSRQRFSQSDHALSMPKSVEGIPKYKYRKAETLVQDSQSECSVCLSVFVEGEDIRELPKCKHQFHADCIDMWLYSHSNCPVCRTDVVVPQALRGGNAVHRGSSREALMNFGNVV